MSKNDINTKVDFVIELNRIIDSLIGFQNLIPEGIEDDCFNLFVRSSLEKIEIDLKKVVSNVCNSI